MPKAFHLNLKEYTNISALHSFTLSFISPDRHDPTLRVLRLLRAPLGGHQRAQDRDGGKDAHHHVLQARHHHQTEDALMLRLWL